MYIFVKIDFILPNEKATKCYDAVAMTTDFIN